MSADKKEVQDRIPAIPKNQNQPGALVQNRWKGKGSAFLEHQNDYLSLEHALYNAAANLDIEGVKELLEAGADPNSAIRGLNDPSNPPYPSFKAMINEEAEDYPDFPMERYHFNAVTVVIRHEVAKDKEREEILILLFKGGAIPSRCVTSRPHNLDSLLWISARHNNLSDIIMEEIRHIAEAHYFAQTLDAGIQNLLIFEDCAYRASNFYTHFGIPDRIENAKYSLENDGFAMHVDENLKTCENVFTRWQEKVLNPIQERMRNAVAHHEFEPYSSIKSELGLKLEMPTTILCIIANYLDTSLNKKFHSAFTDMHRLRFNALEVAKPRKPLTDSDRYRLRLDPLAQEPRSIFTISWSKLNKSTETLKDLLDRQKASKGNGRAFDHEEQENARAVQGAKDRSCRI